MYLSQGGYSSSRTLYVSQGGYNSGASHFPHAGIVHSAMAMPVYMDPAYMQAAEQYRRMKMMKKISGSTITGKPLALASPAVHVLALPVIHGGIIDSHTHYASVGAPQRAPAARPYSAPHFAYTESGHYYGRSDYATRKEAEYRAKYGGKYGVGVQHLVQGAGPVNEELDEYIHSSGTGFKQWLRRRKARKEIKRSVQYELLHQALAQRHGAIAQHPNHVSAHAPVNPPAAFSSSVQGTDV